jgi:hypothetical protein
VWEQQYWQQQRHQQQRRDQRGGHRQWHQQRDE